MSEIDLIAKELEYCLNARYFNPARALVTELIAHRANIRFEFTMNYNCVSHDSYFKQDFAHNIREYFIIFEPCLHVICCNCFKYYTESIFNKFGLHYKYICPGCSVLACEVPTSLFSSDCYIQFFNHFIPPERQQEWKEQIDIMRMTIKQSRAQDIQKSICYFFINPDQRIDCAGVAQTMTMPGCRHKVCANCIEKSLSLCGDQPPFKCFVPTCPKNLADLFIKNLLIPNSQNMIRILRNLRIEGRSIFTCPNCHQTIETESHVIEIECPQCNKDLCAGCGNYSHGDIPCQIAKLSDLKYMEIECSDSDPNPEIRDYYFDAFTLFSWDLEPKRRAKLMTRYKIQFKIKKVFKIVNPKLQKLYDMHKSEIRQRGIDPDEKWVFYATENQFYDEICKNGFKVEGIDAPYKVGQFHGYGILTATDPSTVITRYINKKIILCKGLTGKKSNNIITTKDEFLMNTEYHSCFLESHNSECLSNYIHYNHYVFFNKEYVLPYFYIEYE